MLRLTGGTHRGHPIETPSHLHTRPTQAKLRQALFNSIQALIQDARVLDLFSGSGALGLEALSRGAAFVLFVENSRSTAQIIYKNIKKLGFDRQSFVLTLPVEHALSEIQKHAPFDLVFADPPYGEGHEKTLLALPWDVILSEGGRFCFEWGLQGVKKSEFEKILPESTGFLVKEREKIYGETVLTTYRRGGSEG